MVLRRASVYLIRVFFNDTATTEIYTLSLHDALPILGALPLLHARLVHVPVAVGELRAGPIVEAAERAPVVVVEVLDDLEGPADRKSTRLNSSHANISYAVFCLKKKKATLRLGRAGRS